MQMSTAIAKNDVLGLGIYTPQQAAYLARVRPQTAHRWFDQEAAKGPVIPLQMPQDEEHLVSFIDLIQLLAVRSIRLKRKLSLQKIRATVAKAQEFDVPYPLATEGFALFLLSGEVVLRLPTGDLITATGKHRGSYLMEPVVLPYMDQIHFDAQSGLAAEYRPMPGILLRPVTRWGAPIVEGTGYTAETLVMAVQTEGSIEAAARACGVVEDAVKKALHYEDFLSGAAA